MMRDFVADQLQGGRASNSGGIYCLQLLIKLQQRPRCLRQALPATTILLVHQDMVTMTDVEVMMTMMMVLLV
jgi:hypothetical protein